MACHSGELHAWVAAECERTQRLPEAFKEVWARLEAGDELLAAAGGDENERVEQGPASEFAERGAMGENELHARLRRQIRHSMHVMMQQANPGSYYAEIEHMTPT